METGTQSNNQSIAIVMPALNEAAVVGRQIHTLRTHPALQTLPIERVIVVDNGSDDATAAVARAAGAEVISEPQRGYGAACLAGVRAAEGADIILLMDADGSDDPAGAAQVAALVLRSEADLAMGSRTRGTSEPGALTPQQRAGNAVGALLLRILYGLHVSDIGPVRAIRREALLRLDMREMAYGWSAEMLAKAARAGLTIHEVPVDYYRRAGGKSKVAGTLSGTVKASVHILHTLSRYTRWQPDLASPPTSLARKGELSKRNALFIVARAPIAGQTKTRLGKVIGHEAATVLYRAFLSDLGERFTAAAARDDYDLFWFYAAPDAATAEDFAQHVPPGGELLRQQSGDLGQRLWQGFQALSMRGYERVVVVSSDSPHLPAAWVRDAFAALDTHDVVIGPAHDGGYYLLGQRTRPMPSDIFTGIQMSTAHVYTQTVARARGLGLHMVPAPPTFDVDEAADLDALRAVLTAAPSADADPAPATLAALDMLTPPPDIVSMPALEGAVHGQA